MSSLHCQKRYAENTAEITVIRPCQNLEACSAHGNNEILAFLQPSHQPLRC